MHQIVIYISLFKVKKYTDQIGQSMCVFSFFLFLCLEIANNLDIPKIHIFSRNTSKVEK